MQPRRWWNREWPAVRDAGFAPKGVGFPDGIGWLAPYSRVVEVQPRKVLARMVLGQSCIQILLHVNFLKWSTAGGKYLLGVGADERALTDTHASVHLKNASLKFHYAILNFLRRLIYAKCVRTQLVCNCWLWLVAIFAWHIGAPALLWNLGTTAIE